MEFSLAKKALDQVINKGRIHLYKPIQVAEILYRDRCFGDLNLNELESYRTRSRKWRDLICVEFLGRTSSSSARYQDDLFNLNAVPPEALEALAQKNRSTQGGVEAYIYQKFFERFGQVSRGLQYVQQSNRSSFDISAFINLFWHEPGLRRSLDKVYEIIVYALFQALIESIQLKLRVSYNPDCSHIVKEFADFTERVLKLSPDVQALEAIAKFHRTGVTNAADRGLDVWANFGLVIQIKHLSLSLPLAEDIVSHLAADRVIIVCKSAEEGIIISLLKQIGWQARIQSIITESDLSIWYDRALNGTYGSTIGPRVLEILEGEVLAEFPASQTSEFEAFWSKREYDKALPIES